MSIRLARVHHHNSRSLQSKQSTLHESVNALQPLSTSLLIIIIHFHITIQQYIASILCTISNAQFFHIATALVLAATHEVIYNLQNTILQLKVLRTHWYCTNHFPPSTQSHLVTNLITRRFRCKRSSFVAEIDVSAPCNCPSFPLPLPSRETVPRLPPHLLY